MLDHGLPEQDGSFVRLELPCSERGLPAPRSILAAAPAPPSTRIAPTGSVRCLTQALFRVLPPQLHSPVLPSGTG